MKKKVILIVSIIILLIGSLLLTLFILNKNSNKNMYINIDEYRDKEPGIYLINEKNSLYALIIYKAEYDALIEDLTIKVINKNNQLIEEVKTNSDNKNLKKDEIGYFIGKIKSEFDKKNTYLFDISYVDKTIGNYIVNGININNYINKSAKLMVSSDGLIICMYKNETKTNVNIENCEVVFRNSNDEEIETVIALPEKTTVKPNETIYFANYAKQYSDAVDFKFTTATFNFE